MTKQTRLEDIAFAETLADTVDPRAAQEFLIRARNMADAHKRFLFR